MKGYAEETLNEKGEVGDSIPRPRGWLRYIYSSTPHWVTRNTLALLGDDINALYVSVI